MGVTEVKKKKKSADSTGGEKVPKEYLNTHSTIYILLNLMPAKPRILLDMCIRQWGKI